MRGWMGAGVGVEMRKKGGDLWRMGRGRGGEEGEERKYRFAIYCEIR